MLTSRFVNVVAFEDLSHSWGQCRLLVRLQQRHPRELQSLQTSLEFRLEPAALLSRLLDWDRKVLALLLKIQELLC